MMLRTVVAAYRCSARVRGAGRCAAVRATIDRLIPFCGRFPVCPAGLGGRRAPRCCRRTSRKSAVVVDVVSPTQRNPPKSEPDVAAPDLPAVIVSVPPPIPALPNCRRRRLPSRRPTLFPTALARRLDRSARNWRAPPPQGARSPRRVLCRAARPAALGRRQRFHAEGAVRDEAAQGGRRGRPRPGELPGSRRCLAAKALGRRVGGGRTEAQRCGDRSMRGTPAAPASTFPALRPRHADPRASGRGRRFSRPLPRHRMPGAALAAFNPPHAGYRALKARLAELRASRPARPMRARSAGRALRVGMRDPRVPLIRARFNLGPGRGDETRL